MIQKIFNTREFQSVFSQSLPVQILLLQNDDAISKSVTSTVTKLEKRYSDMDINFYSADTSSSKVKPLTNIYNLESDQAVLFFKEGKLESKIVGDLSTLNLESKLHNLLQEAS